MKPLAAELCLGGINVLYWGETVWRMMQYWSATNGLNSSQDLRSCNFSACQPFPIGRLSRSSSRDYHGTCHKRLSDDLNMSHVSQHTVPCTKVATSLILAWVQTICGRPVSASFSKLLLPCVRCWCQLNITLRPKASLPYTCFIIWNVSLAVLPNFWENLTFACCSNCIFRLLWLTLNFLSQQRPCSSACTICMQLSLAGMREDLTYHHPVVPLILYSVPQWHCAPSPWT